MKPLIPLILLLSLSSWLHAQTLSPQFTPPLSPRLANYTITAKFNAETKRITASESLVWKNHTRDTVRTLQFHLYLNAFRNNRSTFFRESGGQLRGDESKENGWGYITLEKIFLITSQGKLDLKPRIKFIQPDDGNADDQTVIEISLPQPVLPYSSATIEIDFISQLPKVFARTGYAGEFVLAGQWFPKIGVYEGAGERYIDSAAAQGQWNCHQFHGNSEFFADFGVYDVSIDVPKNYIVGATGVRQSEQVRGETKTLHFTAEDVHDFAWTASPHFQTFTDTVRSADGHLITIYFLAQPSHASDEQVARHFTAVKHTIAHHEEWFGVYPYPAITVVDPPYNGTGAGGMEYPTFITTGTFWNLPLGIRSPEIVTVHEFGHQYFQGMLASNEFEEAWLDEGMNTYAELKVTEKFYTRHALHSKAVEHAPPAKPDYFDDKTSFIDWLGLRLGNVEQARLAYTNPGSVKRDIIVKPGWKYERGGYGTFSYSKPGTMMLTLENLLGAEVMKKVMRTYFERFRFKHPTTKDFIAVATEVAERESGKERTAYLSSFFQQFLYTTAALDYAVQSISNERPETASDSLYESKVIIERREEAVLPVEVVILFSDSSTAREAWDGRDRYKVFRYSKPVKVIKAAIDPEHKILLDLNFTNNQLTVAPETAGLWRWVSKIGFWFQNVMLAVLSLT
ncbi:MAG: M1 family metallopeptidase [Rhizobacter sp.]|nr:M1 family metallopeptidase [Chlorobiales bacterium]